MRKLLFTTLAALSGLVAGDASRAAVEGTVTDIGGTWFFHMAGQRGTLVMNFGVPDVGVFTARGVGFAKEARTFFAVKNEQTYSLAFLSSGSIVGTLPLEDQTQSVDIGTLTITSGSLNISDQRTLLKGTLAIGGKTRKVVLRGERLAPPELDPSGGSFDGVVAGNRIVSRKLDVTVQASALMSIVDGSPAAHPFYDVNAGGPVRVDGGEVPVFSFSGSLVDDNKSHVTGRVITSQYGAALLTGRFLVNPRVSADRPVLDCLITPDKGRKFRVRALMMTGSG